MKNIALKILILLVSFSLSIRCNDDDASKGNAQVAIRLTDAPGDYEHVYIDVEDVIIKYSDDDNNDDDSTDDDGLGNVSDASTFDNVNAGIYDLLELTGGTTVLLANEDIPSGEISQIRLLLGSQNSIVVNGSTYDLATPSGQQSGLKINLQQELNPDTYYEFILDFDVEKSIVTQGNGGYSLKPVIRATAVEQTGAISGAVNPVETLTLVTATNIVDSDIEVSAYTNANGLFKLYGLPEGIYTLTYTPDNDSGYEEITVQNVSVSNENTTTVDTVFFEEDED